MSDNDKVAAFYAAESARAGVKEVTRQPDGALSVALAEVLAALERWTSNPHTYQLANGEYDREHRARVIGAYRRYAELVRKVGS